MAQWQSPLGANGLASAGVFIRVRASIHLSRGGPRVLFVTEASASRLSQQCCSHQRQNHTACLR